MSEQLFLKEKNILKNDIELIFHKDYSYIYNSEKFPIVKYMLTDCENLNKINFDTIDYYTDGILIETESEKDYFIFKTTDLGGVVTQIKCKKVLREELAYRTTDFINLIQEITKQLDSDNDINSKLNQKLSHLRTHIKKELEIINRKLSQADWLSVDKKQFMEGQKSSFTKIIEIMDEKPATDK